MTDTQSETQELLRDKHAKYFMRCLNILPPSMVSLDAIRLSIAFFTISGLDVLGRLSLLEKNRTDIIDAIYQFQISSSSDHSSIDRCGFRGSLAAATALGHCRPDGVVGADSAHPLDTSHITMTYAALNTLLILGDDLSRLDRRGILTGIRALQLPNGSFAATLQGSESDVRFVYCAASICHLLNDWSGADRQAATNYIVNCINYDGALGQDANQEGHAGLTYCGIAALSLMGTLDVALTEAQKRKLKRWLVLRQQSGFQGRPNKPVDTCYSFWVSATLQLLDGRQFIDRASNRRFVLETQCRHVGGLAKWIDHDSDPLHSYLGLAGLSVCQEPGLEEVHPALNLSMRAYRHWQQLPVANQ